MTRVILTDCEPAVCEALEQRGFRIIPSCTVERFIPYEQRHADMQCLIIEDAAFVLSCCQELCRELSSSYRVIPCGTGIKGEYPHNIALNALTAGNTLIGNLPYIDEKVLQYCQERHYRMISVKQGYTRCSCLKIGDNALITADQGIYRTLIGERGYSEKNLLLIEEGGIRLSDTAAGFIGGASGYCNGTVFFAGDITRHPSYRQIRSFCSEHHTEIVSLTDHMLVDIGGMIFC